MNPWLSLVGLLRRRRGNRRINRCRDDSETVLALEPREARLVLTTALQVLAAPPVVEGGTAAFDLVLRDFTTGAEVQAAALFFVALSTQDLSATSGQDYQGASFTTSFPAGTSRISVNVATFDDAVIEGSETFLLRVTNISDTGIVLFAGGANVGAILDDEPPATLSIVGPDKISEGDGTITFQIRLTVPDGLLLDPSVSFSLDALPVPNVPPGDPAAAEPLADFELRDGIGTSAFGDFAFGDFPPGSTGTTDLSVDVFVIDDPDAEGDETFKFLLFVGTDAVDVADGGAFQVTICASDAFTTPDPPDPASPPAPPAPGGGAPAGGISGINANDARFSSPDLISSLSGDDPLSLLNGGAGHDTITLTGPDPVVTTVATVTTPLQSPENLGVAVGSVEQPRSIDELLQWARNWKSTRDKTSGEGDLPPEEVVIPLDQLERLQPPPDVPGQGPPESGNDVPPQDRSSASAAGSAPAAAQSVQLFVGPGPQSPQIQTPPAHGGAAVRALQTDALMARLANDSTRLDGDSDRDADSHAEHGWAAFLGGFGLTGWWTRRRLRPSRRKTSGRRRPPAKRPALPPPIWYGSADSKALVHCDRDYLFSTFAHEDD